ncbi:MAG: hypothetical protein Q9165_002267 [Trypethelium subeluteriae]
MFLRALQRRLSGYLEVSEKGRDNNDVSEPFLKENSDQDAEQLTNKNYKMPFGRTTQLMAFHLGLIAMYTLVLGVVVYRSGTMKEPAFVYSPAKSAIHYTTIAFDQGGQPHSAILTGDPTPEDDKAWDELLKYGSFAVSDDDLGKLNMTSIPIQDGTGRNLAQLGVFHDLHCMKRIRQWAHRDSYFPNMSEAEYKAQTSHAGMYTIHYQWSRY